MTVVASARNDSCLSRLRLERTVVSLALQASPQPSRPTRDPQKIARFSGAGRPSPPPTGGGRASFPRMRGDERGALKWPFCSPTPFRSEPVGMETQDFSPSARNDMCSSRLRLEMTVVVSARNDMCSSRLRHERTVVDLAFGSKRRSYHQFFKSPPPPPLKADTGGPRKSKDFLG